MCKAFNFEIVHNLYKEFSRFQDFGNLSFKKDVVFKVIARSPRSVCISFSLFIFKTKAYEKLVHAELIKPIEGAGSKCPREFKMYKVLFTPSDVIEMVTYSADCPEVIRKWAKSS
jgi:hypothetical protein